MAGVHRWWRRDCFVSGRSASAIFGKLHDRARQLQSSSLGVQSLGGSKESDSVKIVRGVKFVSRRTLSLVERFERRDTITPSEEDKAVIVQSTNSVEEVAKSSSIRAVSPTPTQVMEVELDEATNLTRIETHVIFIARANCNIQLFLITNAVLCNFLTSLFFI